MGTDIINFGVDMDKKMELEFFSLAMTIRSREGFFVSLSGNNVY